MLKNFYLYKFFMSFKKILLFFIIFLFLIQEVFSNGDILKVIFDVLNSLLFTVYGPYAVTLIAVFGVVGLGLVIVFLFFIVFPTITLYAMIYGFLSQLRIFRSRTINLIIAITIATPAMFFPLPIPIPFLNNFPFPLPLFGIFVVLLFTALNFWLAFLFFLMISFGAWYIFLGKKRKWGTSAAIYHTYKDEANSLRFELRTTNEAIADVMRNMAKETDPAKRAALETTLQTLSDRRNDISDRITQMEQIRKRL